VELFCHMVYQNGFNSTDRVVYGVEAKNGFPVEAKPYLAILRLMLSCISMWGC